MAVSLAANVWCRSNWYARKGTIPMIDSSPTMISPTHRPNVDATTVAESTETLSFMSTVVCVRRTIANETAAVERISCSVTISEDSAIRTICSVRLHCRFSQMRSSLSNRVREGDSQERRTRRAARKEW
jgi:hypothetical protein